MKLYVVACEILTRELEFLASRSPHVIDLRFLPKSLHDAGRKTIFAALTESLARLDTTGYDAILLGYGLCSGGIVGVAAGAIPLVVPRMHDCIGLFLGSHRAYLDHLTTYPGTFFLTTGWIERGGDLRQAGFGEYDFATLATRYGVENAEYILEKLRPLASYRRIAFLETGIEPNDSLETRAKQRAVESGWEFEKESVSLDLFRRLLDGDWNPNEFLVVQPGERIDFDFGEDVIRAVPIDDANSAKDEKTLETPAAHWAVFGEAKNTEV